MKESIVKTPANRRYPGRRQTIHAGSYVIVPDNDEFRQASDFSVGAIIFPTIPNSGRQGILTKWSIRNKAGIALIIDNGSIALCLGNGDGQEEIIRVDNALISHQWYLVGATWDGRSGEVCVYQEPLRDYPSSHSRDTAKKTCVLNVDTTTSAPLIMGACFDRTVKGKTRVVWPYNGKIDSPRFASKALSFLDLQKLLYDEQIDWLADCLLGAWDFSQEIESDSVIDLSANELHGRTVNLPARAVTGFNWTSEELCWRHAPKQWSAIHFHEDDVYDALWEADFELTISQNMRSGLYAARLRSRPHEEYIPFVVKPAPGKESKIALVLPSGTYLAYGNEHLGTDTWETGLITYRITELHPHHLFLNDHREYGLCFYDLHIDGSPVYYSSRLRPLLNVRPKCQGVLGGYGSSLWNFNADTHIIDWLDMMGYQFDIFLEEDIHFSCPELLKPYKVVITGTHPEYVSKNVLDAISRFTMNGGRLLNLGGNTFYFRIAYHPELPGVIECRWDVGPGEAPPGEHYCSFTGEASGLWRRQGRAPQVVTGVGYIAQGFDFSSYYRRTPESFDPRARFIFDGIGADELIGDFGLIGGGAAGLELDCYDRALGSPPHALVVARSEGHTDTYRICVEEIDFTYPGTSGTENSAVHADMVFYETEMDGAVFSTGSIAWAGSLSHNNYCNNVSKITMNVLNRFLDSSPFSQ